MNSASASASSTSTSTNAPQTTVIWGLVGPVMRIAEASGTIPRTVRYNDGQTVVSVVIFFEGGYDDYDGSAGWAEVPGVYPGRPVWFSPRPGCWMSGVRV